MADNLAVRGYRGDLALPVSSITRNLRYLTLKTQFGSSNGASVGVASIGCMRRGIVDVRLIDQPLCFLWACQNWGVDLS